LTDDVPTSMPRHVLTAAYALHTSKDVRYSRNGKPEPKFVERCKPEELGAPDACTSSMTCATTALAAFVTRGLDPVSSTSMTGWSRYFILA
jgi:hypothetical protein